MPSETVERVKRFWPLVEEQAIANGVRPALLAGLVCQESGGNRYADRYEEKFKWIPRYPDGSANVAIIRQRMPANMSLATEIQGLKTSHGLCQVMGENLRAMGFRGWWKAMGEPDLALRYGAKFLSAKLATNHDDERAALQVYNTGRPDITGPDPYCDKVLAWAKEFEDEG